jgi:hypothetical protein
VGAHSTTTVWQVNRRSPTGSDWHQLVIRTEALTNAGRAVFHIDLYAANRRPSSMPQEVKVTAVFADQKKQVSTPTACSALPCEFALNLSVLWCG